MNTNAEFQTICGGCGSLAIKIENPLSASGKAAVYCGGCGASRGTLGALRDLAVLRDVNSRRTPEVKYQSELVAMHRELQGLRRKVHLAEVDARQRQPMKTHKRRGAGIAGSPETLEQSVVRSSVFTNPIPK